MVKYANLKGAKKSKQEKKKFKIGRGRGVKRNNLFMPRLNDSNGLINSSTRLNDTKGSSNGLAMRDRDREKGTPSNSNGASFWKKNPSKIYMGKPNKLTSPNNIARGKNARIKRRR